VLDFSSPYRALLPASGGGERGEGSGYKCCPLLDSASKRACAALECAFAMALRVESVRGTRIACFVQIVTEVSWAEGQMNCCADMPGMDNPVSTF
jgi:hypothetical protein